MGLRRADVRRIQGLKWFGILSLIGLCCVGPWDSARGQDVAEVEQAVFKSAIAKFSPSVVQLETFGGQEKVGELSVPGNITNGILVSEDGFILSSQYAFLQRPASIVVAYPDGNRGSAQIVARDHSRLLVLLKASVPPGKKLVVPEPVALDKIRVGQWAIAVGRAFDATKVNSSVGIVSAKDRVWGKAIQTDAKVSPNNYGGGLIDIEGRLLGILTPLSPHSQEVIAGAEWYDGGIGFAVPFVDLLPVLERMKKGNDVHPGLLGISYKGEDPYAGPLMIANCSPKSPAFKAGIRAGDQIVAVNGERVEMVAHLRHALGRRYAGEKVQVDVRRGEQSLSFPVELAQSIEPYERPFLGVLPERQPGNPQKPDGVGVVVRYVFSPSGADQAGLKAGDRIVKLDGKPIASAAELRTALSQREVGDILRLDVVSGDAPRNVELKLTANAADVPAKLPAHPPLAKAPEARPAVGVVDVRLPEEGNECFAYVPEDYDHQFPYGLVVWLHAPEKFERDALLERWKSRCQRERLILLSPASAAPARWQPSDAGFVRKALEQIVANYRVDRTRIVVHGYQAGGAMAYFVAFSQREWITGVAPVDAPVPQRIRLPENEPVYPLSIYSTSSEKSPLVKLFQAGHDLVRKAKFPLVEKKLPGEPRYLQDAELDELLLWIDTLDRI